MEAIGWVAVASVLGAAICMGIGAIGPAIGEGRALAQALSSIAQQPDETSTITRTCSWAWPWWNRRPSTVSW